jgi:hypothetical protein
MFDRRFDNVTSTHSNKKLAVRGSAESADNDTNHYALKHIQKRHRHFLRQIEAAQPVSVVVPKALAQPIVSQNTHAGPYNFNTGHAHNYEDDHNGKLHTDIRIQRLIQLNSSRDSYHLYSRYDIPPCTKHSALNYFYI